MTPQDIFDRFGGYDPNALAFDPAAGCEPEEHLIYPSLRTCTVNITNEDDDFQREHEDRSDTSLWRMANASVVLYCRRCNLRAW